MWFEFLFEGVRKFAGEIIGLILLAVFWRKFPRLWKWVSEHKNLNKDDNAEVRQALKNIQRQLEAQRQEQERIQAEIRRKEKLSQEEARKLEEALRKTEVKQQPVVKKQPAMSDEDFMKLCMSGDARKVEEAIMNGANVNARGYRGDTALILAVLKTETAELLLKHGADVR